MAITTVRWVTGKQFVGTDARKPLRGAFPGTIRPRGSAPPQMLLIGLVGLYGVRCIGYHGQKAKAVDHVGSRGQR